MCATNLLAFGDLAPRSTLAPQFQPTVDLQRPTEVLNAVEPYCLHVRHQGSLDEVDVVAVVITENSAYRLDTTLRTLFAKDSPVGASIVVGHGSRNAYPRIATTLSNRTTLLKTTTGRAAAMASGVTAAKTMFPEAAVLFVDADLEVTSPSLDVLCQPVLAGRTDMTIAVDPHQSATRTSRFLTHVAAQTTEDLTGWRPTQPLSGIRCIRRQTLDQALPLANGWAANVGLTIDVLRKDGRIQEVLYPSQHPGLQPQALTPLLHMKQYRDLWLALATRRKPLHQPQFKSGLLITEHTCRVDNHKRDEHVGAKILD